MDYYLWLDETQRGPYSPADLKHMLATQQISLSSIVWREGMEGWVPLSSVYEQLSLSKTDRKTRDYYILVNGTQQGPYSIEQLKEMWTSGKITKKVKVWYEGLGDWRTFESILSALFPVSPSLSLNVEKNEKKDRKPAIIGVFALFILLYIANPYIATYQLFSALKNGDAEALKRRVDFPELRESLKEEIKATMLQQAKKSISKASKEDNPMGLLGAGLAAAFGPTLIDGLVDSFVTPSGLAQLIANPKEATKASNRRGEFSPPKLNLAFFVGLTEFKITTREGVSLFLHLNGIGWKLNAISWGDTNVDVEDSGETKEQRAESDLQAISMQLRTYEMFNYRMPTTEQGLKALVQEPTSDPKPRKWKQLMKSVPLDPWGSEYIYRNPDKNGTKGYDLFSLGPDGKESDDDVRYSY